MLGTLPQPIAVTQGTVPCLCFSASWQFDHVILGGAVEVMNGYKAITMVISPITGAE
jgi:hypothetical protein